MPTYEYACPKCGHHFEKFQSMNDERLKNARSAGRRASSASSGAGGLIFKGSGFYEHRLQESPREEGGHVPSRFRRHQGRLRRPSGRDRPEGLKPDPKPPRTQGGGKPAEALKKSALDVGHPGPFPLPALACPKG